MPPGIGYPTKPRAPGALGSPGVMQLPLPPTLGQPAATTNLGGIPQPVAPTPMQSPNLPQSPGPLQYTPTSVGPAPTATPFGTFQAPDPTQLENDKYYQFRRSQMQKGLERGAAAHGTLFSGGFQSALAERLGNLASAEGDKIYGRALNDYTTNRDTARGNFGESLGSYQAGTGAQLDAGRMNLAGAGAVYGSQRDIYGDARSAAVGDTGVINANQQAQDLYAQQMAEYRAALERQQMEAAEPPPPVRRGGFRGGSLGAR